MSDRSLFDDWTATTEPIRTADKTSLSEATFRDRLYEGDPPQGWRETLRRWLGTLREQNPDRAGGSTRLWKVGGDGSEANRYLMEHQDEYYELRQYRDYRRIAHAVWRGNMATSRFVGNRIGNTLF